MITRIEPIWNSKWANDPDILITLDCDIYKELEWIWTPVPNPQAREKTMLISMNHYPFVRFVYIDDPDGSPNRHGALGGNYKMPDGSEFSSNTGWSSRAGVINRDYLSHLPQGKEITEVTTSLPGWNVKFAGTCIEADYLRNHELWPSDLHLVRELKFTGEPCWTISTEPDKVVKGDG